MLPCLHIEDETNQSTNQPTNPPTISTLIGTHWIWAKCFQSIQSCWVWTTCEGSGSAMCWSILCNKFGAIYLGVVSIRQMHSNDESGPNSLCCTRYRHKVEKKTVAFWPDYFDATFAGGCSNEIVTLGLGFVGRPVFTLADVFALDEMKLPQVELRSFVQTAAVNWKLSFLPSRYSAQTATEKPHTNVHWW